MPTTLHADSLWSKFGFGDGDLLWEPLCDLGFEDVSDRVVLKRCIHKYLLPALPSPVEVWEIGGIHNPVRAVDFGKEDAPEWARTFSVELSDEVLVEEAAVARSEGLLWDVPGDEI